MAGARAADARAAGGRDSTRQARLRPPGPASTAKRTRWPAWGRGAPPWKALMCTNTGSPPCSGSMKPKPRASFQDAMTPSNCMRRQPGATMPCTKCRTWASNSALVAVNSTPASTWGPEVLRVTTRAYTSRAW